MAVRDEHPRAPAPDLGSDDPARLYSKNGIEATTVDEIAAASGVSSLLDVSGYWRSSSSTTRSSFKPGPSWSAITRRCVSANS